MTARDLGIDPVAMRRRNLITAPEMPYSIGQLVPYETETAYDSGDYAAALDKCLDAFGWAEKIKLQGRKIEGRYHGLGVACFVESGGAGPRENVRMTLERDGRITVAVGSSVLGQGLETIFAQIAADAMGLPFDTFRVIHGSTTIVDEGFGTYHSRAVVMGGSAILDGAKNLIAQIGAAASLQFQCRTEDVTFEDGVAHRPGRRTLALADIGAAAGPLSANGTLRTPNALIATAPMPPMSPSTPAPAALKSSTMSQLKMFWARHQSSACARTDIRSGGPGARRRISRSHHLRH